MLRFIKLGFPSSSDELVLKRQWVIVYGELKGCGTTSRANLRFSAWGWLPVGRKGEISVLLIYQCLQRGNTKADFSVLSKLKLSVDWVGNAGVLASSIYMHPNLIRIFYIVHEGKKKSVSYHCSQWKRNIYSIILYIWKTINSFLCFTIINYIPSVIKKIPT